MQIIELHKETLRAFKSASKLTIKNEHERFKFSKGIFLKHNGLGIDFIACTPYYLLRTQIGKLKEPINLDAFIPQETLKKVGNSVLQKDPEMVELKVFDNGLKVGLKKLEGESLQCWSGEPHPIFEDIDKQFDTYRRWRTLEWENMDSFFNLFSKQEDIIIKEKGKIRLYKWDLKISPACEDNREIKEAYVNIDYISNLANFMRDVTKCNRLLVDFYFKDGIADKSIQAVKLRVGRENEPVLATAWLMTVRM